MQYEGTPHLSNCQPYIAACLPVNTAPRSRSRTRPKRNNTAHARCASSSFSPTFRRVSSTTFERVQETPDVVASLLLSVTLPDSHTCVLPMQNALVFWCLVGAAISMMRPLEPCFPRSSGLFPPQSDACECGAPIARISWGVWEMGRMRLHLPNVNPHRAAVP